VGTGEELKENGRPPIAELRRETLSILGWQNFLQHPAL